MFQQIASLQEDTTGRNLLSSNEAGAEADRAVAEACREGSVSAFEDLYRTHGRRMKSVAMNLLGSTADAEDAVQEAFLKLYRSLGTFKGQSQLSTWLYRILVNTCYDMGRKRKRRPEVPEADPAEGDPQIPAPAADHPLRLTLEHGLATLAPLHRTVFLLYEVEGFTHREVGEILAIAEGTSKHALFEAKRGLRSVVLATRRLRRKDS